MLCVRKKNIKNKTRKKNTQEEDHIKKVIIVISMIKWKEREKAKVGKVIEWKEVSK